jgi:hypothetical protein
LWVTSISEDFNLYLNLILINLGKGDNPGLLAIGKSTTYKISRAKLLK